MTCMKIKHRAYDISVQDNVVDAERPTYLENTCVGKQHGGLMQGARLLPSVFHLNE